jgi:hypothetical protein
MKKIIKKENIHTVCPYCTKEIESVWVCKIKSIIGIRFIFFCSECQKNIGISLQNEYNSRNFKFANPGMRRGINNLY